MLDIKNVSYTPEVISGLHQSVMLYKALLEQAKKETKSSEEAYELADHVFKNMLQSSQQ